MAYQIRHQTLSSIIKEIEAYILAKGYTVPEVFTNFGYWTHVEYNTTQRFNELLMENGKKSDGIAFQIYRDDRGMYELNMYFWR